MKLDFEAWRHPSFRRYLIGNAFALHAMWIQRTTVAWLAWDMTGAASFVGLIAFLGFVPTLLTGPIFGAVVDRAPLKRAASLAQGLLMLLSLCFAVLHTAGGLSAPIMAALALAVGIVMSGHHPIRMSLAPRLAPRAAVASVVAATALNFNLARTAGPALGGVLIASWGPGAALWLVTACFVPFQLIIPTLRLRPRDGTPPPAQGLWAGLRQGVRFALANRFVRRLLLTTAVFAVGARGMLELLPLIADAMFGQGPAGLGTLTSAAGLGAVVAAAFVAMLPRPVPGILPPAGLSAVAAGTLLTLALPLAPSWPAAVGIVALLGAAGTVMGVSLQSALQTVLSDELRGRVMSLWIMTGIGSAALGALALGALADRVGLAGGAGLVYGALGLGLVLLRRRI